MPKKEVGFDALSLYLPDGCLNAVLKYIYDYKVQLTITRRRKTILGDYRHAHAGEGHRISVNGDLNKYAFLITLLHETAHLITFEKHGRKVQPHGKEWKLCFGNILREFIESSIFPHDLESTLLHTLKNPAASSCGDENLLRVLRNYDLPKEGFCFVEEIKPGEKFKTKDGRIFEKSLLVIKRFKCRETSTGKWYLFSPVYEVFSME